MSITGKKYIADTFDFEKNLLKKAGSGATRGVFSVQPNGAHYFNTGSSQTTGAIKISLGGTGGRLDDMLQFWVDIYDYASREMVTVKIGGYIYEGVGGVTWTNVQAMILAQLSSKDFTVRFGDDGTNHCVWIGEVNSIWSHPQVTIRDFSAGYEVPDNDVYTAAWSVSFATSFGTVNDTLSNNLPLSSGGTSGGFLPLSAGSGFPLTGDLHSNESIILGSAKLLKFGGNGARIYGDNTNQFLTFDTNSLERMRIAANGNIGIGQTGPGQHLVIGNYLSAADGTMRITSVGGNPTPGTITSSLEFSKSSEYSVNSGDAYRFSLGLNSAAGVDGQYNSDFVVRRTTRLGVTDNVDFLIDGRSGNVGIATISPIEKLTVDGRVYVEQQGIDWNETTPGTTRGALHFDPQGDAAAHTGNAITFGASDNAGGASAFAGIYTRSDGSYGTKMYFATTDSYAIGSKTAMMIDYNGNVGIGTASPGYKLDVLKVGADGINIGCGNDFGGLRLTSDSGAWAIRTSTGDDLFFYDVDNTSQVVTFKRGGNVGIGTTGPANKLEVNETSGGTILRLRNGDGSLVNTGDVQNSIVMNGRYWSGANSDFVETRINSLHQDSDGNGGSALTFMTQTGGSPPQEQVRINKVGNLGIGTTNPTAKLQVSGRIGAGELGNSKVTRNGLNYYVDFNDKACVSGNSPTEVPLDLGPNNYLMALYGGANFEYKDGIGCYYFDGSADHINIENYVVADASNSYEFWHYSNTQNGWETWWDSGTERPLLGTSGSNLWAYPGVGNIATINTGKWYHVVFAFASNNDLDTYVNGVRVSEAANWNSTQRTGTFTAWLGGDTTAETTDGWIAIARTYGRQLTPAEVLQNYNAEVSMFATVTPSLGLAQAGGNVGINTIAPTAALQVGDTANSGKHILVVGNSTDTSYTVFKGARNAPRIDLYDTSVEGSFFDIWNVGNQLRFGTNTSTSAFSGIVIKDGNSPDVYFNGDVGVGTANPDRSLTIGDSASSSINVKTATNNVIWEVEGVGTSNLEGSQGLYYQNTKKIQFRANDASYFAGGKVYIGSTSNINTRSELFQLTGGQVITDTGTGSPHLYLGYNSSGANTIQLGRGRTADGISYMDFNGEVMAAGAYGFRIIRNSGANASTLLQQVGTGDFEIYTNGSESMRIDSSGNITQPFKSGSGLLDINGGEMLAHGGSTPFTRSFNPVDIWGMPVQGGMVRLEVAGWSQRVNCGYIQFQNAGGNGVLTSVVYVQTAINGSGQISVAINSANNNTIDVNFTGWHSNAHAWRCRVSLV